MLLDARLIMPPPLKRSEIQWTVRKERRKIFFKPATNAEAGQGDENQNVETQGNPWAMEKSSRLYRGHSLENGAQLGRWSFDMVGEIGVRFSSIPQPHSLRQTP